ncbi:MULTISPECIES: beta-propeller domain-containing protein [unclassified Corallococcus]|uniref:beta-propeller domain-containing protein n=1 Tax=unclassified Corallococcus TaxID=2685029 RepID=UPI001A8E76BB|nr:MULTISPECIES: beta-propeller domain-containing protein [unclassified Corallococcus]MBN9681018.1 beta-propeller domain-containing protein [Corallococcus sp. NCSPR001]WAS87387.1 beta-propeller domain-containing protein [Corallococcus sp. NCRR]
MRFSLFGTVGLTLLAVGCGDGGKAPEGLDNEPVQQSLKLTTFDDCSALERYIEDTATKQMRASLEQQKPGYWERFGRRGGIIFGPMPAEDSAGGGVTSGSGNQAPQDSTGTNNQVEGVHESDFVQNDGTRIFVLSGNRLYAHRSWPAEQLTLAATLEVEGWPREMLLDEQNRLVIVSQVAQSLPGTPAKGGGAGGGMVPAVDMACYGFGCGYYNADSTKVTTVDVSDVAHPTVVDQVYLPGIFNQARRVDGNVRLVLSDAFRWPEDVKFWVDYSEDLYKDEGKLTKTIDALIAENEKRIRANTLDQWLPSGRHVDAAGVETSLPTSCGDFYRSNAPSALGFVTVASLDLDARTAAPGRTSLVAEPGTVYASRESLYLAHPHYWWWPLPGQKDFTYLHKFDLTQPGRAVYAGSGTVEGTPINQFALDEYEGVLRMATTVTTRLPEPEHDDWWWGRTTTASRVTTLGLKNGHLAELGRSEDLAEGERIFSARFVGNRGYVVTFLQVDPLFTFDLSDPANPHKVGELKVPGFSTYMHPVGDHHLLTLGIHTDPNGGCCGTRALKLSLFDVDDLANPKEVSTQLVGEAYGWSEALYEHKAFNYFAAKGLVAIPFTDYSRSYGSYEDYWSGFRTDLRVFRVDLAAGISPVGSVPMSDLYKRAGMPQWSYYYTPEVRRSVMADDYVYAISDAGMRVSKVQSLQTPLVTVPFPASTP